MNCNYTTFKGIEVFRYISKSKSKIQLFKERIWAYVKTNDPTHTKYPIWMLKEFVKYWTAKNDNGLKCYFEMEKKWNTGLRLATWKRNCLKDDRWKEPKAQVYKPTKYQHEYTPPPVDYSKYKPTSETKSVGELIRRNGRN